MLYLALAVVGTVWPLMAYLPWMQESGAGLAGLIEAWRANGAVAGLYRDMLIAAAAVTVWILAETHARRDHWVLVCIPVIWLVGLSAGLPLYLFLRARPVA